LIVEIISPSTAVKDHNQKFSLYQEAGVGEYWIVYPLDHEIHVYLLGNGKYEMVGEFRNKGPIPIYTLGGVEMEIADIFEP